MLLNEHQTQVLKLFLACVLFSFDKGFLACILKYLPSDKCQFNNFSWCNWVDFGKFSKYPHDIFEVLGFVYCLSFDVPSFLFNKK